MANEVKALDVVLSYAVSDGVTPGSKEEYEKLAKLLVEGYRVLDVISTPSGATGDTVSVTVVLTSSSGARVPYARGHSDK